MRLGGEHDDRHFGELTDTTAHFVTIQVVGEQNIAQEDWGSVQEDTFASRGQKLIYWGPLKKPLEWTLKTVLAPWSYLASVTSHDSVWYPLVAKARVREVLKSRWGRLFANWAKLTPEQQQMAGVSLRRDHVFKFGQRHRAAPAPTTRTTANR